MADQPPATRSEMSLPLNPVPSEPTLDYQMRTRSARSQIELVSGLHIKCRILCGEIAHGSLSLRLTIYPSPSKPPTLLEAACQRSRQLTIEVAHTHCKICNIPLVFRPLLGLPFDTCKSLGHLRQGLEVSQSGDFTHLKISSCPLIAIACLCFSRENVGPNISRIS